MACEGLCSSKCKTCPNANVLPKWVSPHKASYQHINWTESQPNTMEIIKVHVVLAHDSCLESCDAGISEDKRLRLKSICETDPREV